MRKIIAHIAASADGFIARPDGDVGWLDRPQNAGDYGMKAFYKTIDTVVMGRKTDGVVRLRYAVARVRTPPSAGAGRTRGSR